MEDQSDIQVPRVDVSTEEVAAADAVVLLIDHERFDYAVISTAAYVLDTRRRLAPAPNVEYL